MSSRGEVAFSVKEVKQLLGVKFITESCILLNLSYQSRYKALVLFYNFNEKVDFAGLCMASLLLASKLEEEVCTLKKVIYVFNYLYTRYESKPTPLTNRLSIRLKEGCILAETQILKSLGFDVSFEDVYGDFIDFLQAIDLSPDLTDKAVRVFNTMIQWPRVKDLDSRKLVEAVMESLLGKNKELEDFVARYRLFQEKKFNLETYEEIPAIRNISESLITGFVKRQKRK
ncbi:hypothetical protein EHEL_030320 [Encephalitozoon hellem ATCC 50504]|uniref:Cyclin-T1 n=1 Tax=Encephalitozoon hellem TaxID=27973 RepID=A0A9Q9C9F3_ENCHE|nr:uncharacterized protein EHEL_030320 [Encephalitozoon hellem ATCC 50504]AFM97929.1 hypothetical protein EHEL_030320 [Encephalitozoon hellem ATCC 50504]UTX42733.1 cyclin-T1 [Encephalitozoon hellem]|eukprot:XP_003886910.1 hypothetical protein EHEL_030320 [Encephalitozoon hellem ATCC 50504]